VRRRGDRLRGTAAVVCLVTAVVFTATAVFAAEWDKLSDRDGVLVERRVIPGSRVGEIRVTAHSPLPPASIFETIWRHQEYQEFVPFLKRLTLLSDTGDERITYEQLALPFVRDRDYTVRFRRRMDPIANRYEIVIEGANDAGPPPDGSHIRVTDIHGGWRTEPGIGGKGSTVRYEMKSDPGGLLPAWLVDRTMRHAAVDLMRAMLKRALEKNGTK